MRVPTPVHAASLLTSSSHAHDDELGCHRLAAGGGLGGLRATSFISSDRSLLRDTSGAPASALLCPHSGSFFSVSFSWRRARCFSPYQQPNMSWAVTAWPPVGGLGGRITHRHPHTPSTYTNTHTHTQTHFHTDIDARTETHKLPQLTRLHTSHCTLTG